MTLEDLLNNAFRKDGLAELTIRVSRYAADVRTPVEVQVIAKGQQAITGPWGVGLAFPPGKAVRQALAALDGTAEEGGVFD
jgi:hypothetical protein